MSHDRYRASITAIILGTVLCLFAAGQVLSAQALPAKVTAKHVATPGTAVPPGSYKPRPGQSLDQVITQTMRDSPLKLAVLRQAFIRQNPAAFEAGKTPRLRKGAVLIVPDHAALLLSLMPPSSAAAAPMAVPLAMPVAAPMAASVAAPVDVESASPLTQAVGDDRRQWVRYP